MPYRVDPSFFEDDKPKKPNQLLNAGTAFLQTYLPAKRHDDALSVQERRYQQERADALRAHEMQMSKDLRREKATDAYRKTQDERWNAQEERRIRIDERFAQKDLSEAEDVQTFAQGLGQPTDDHTQFLEGVRGVASKFHNKEFAARYVNEEGSAYKQAIAEREKQSDEAQHARVVEDLDDHIAEWAADPEVTGDPKLKRRADKIALLRQDPETKPAELLRLSTELQDLRDTRTAARQHSQENLSILADRHMKIGAAADALEQSGLGEDAKRLRGMIQASRVHGVRMGRDFEKSDEHMDKALKALSGAEKEPPPITDQGYQRKVFEQALKDIGPADADMDPKGKDGKLAGREVRLAQRMIQIDPRFAQPNPSESQYQTRGLGNKEEPSWWERTFGGGEQQSAPAQSLVPPEIQAQQSAEVAQWAASQPAVLAEIRKMKMRGDSPEQIKAWLIQARGGK